MRAERSSRADAARTASAAPVVTLELIVDVAERLERRDGGRVERGGRPEVAGGGVEIAAIAAPPVGLAAPEIGQHRVRAELDGAAVGLDRGETLVVAQGVVAAGQRRTGSRAAAPWPGRAAPSPTAVSSTTVTTAMARFTIGLSYQRLGWVRCDKELSGKSGSILL